MEGYHSPQVDVEVRLNTNESPEPPPPSWEDEVAAAVASIDWRRYPDRGSTELRTAIGAQHGVGPEQIIVGNGSNEVLQALLLTYGGPGRSAVVLEPTYALHSHIARITGTGVATGERASDFSVDLTELDRVIEVARPSVVFLCSPNNPTGVVDDEATVRAVCGRATAVGALLVVDEAYGQFAPWSAVELVDDDTPLAVTRTFSKTWAMAGARLGYAIAPSWMVGDVDGVLLPYHLDALKQQAGLAALGHGDEMLARVERIVAERTRLVEALHRLDVDLWPSGANFVLFRPRAADGSPGDIARGDEVWQGLVDRSVLVRNCASWPRLAGCLRVTIGTPSEDDRFLTALQEVLT
jgi:histidinol-phosphate aminotransferase